MYRTEQSSQDWGWVSITRVNHRFRVVAIGHASLWATLSLDEDIPRDMFLSRSRQLQLSFKGSFGTRYTTDDPDDMYYHVCYVSENIARVRLLDIELEDPDAKDVDGWLGILNSPAPELREFALELTTSELPVPLGQDIHLDLVASKAPKLRTVSLLGLRMSWTLHTPITTIRSLQLRDTNNTEASRFTILEVLQSLQNLHLLEDLDLQASLPVAGAGPCDPGIDLPYLRRLVLVDYNLRCLVFWASLNVPPTCIVSVNMTDEIENEEADLLQICLRRHFTRNDCPEYRRVMIAGDLRDVSPHSERLTRWPMNFALYTTSGSKVDVTRQDLSKVYRPLDRCKNDEASTLRLSFRAKRQTDLICSLIALIPKESVDTLWICEDITVDGLDVAQLVSEALHHFNATRTLSISGKTPDVAFWLIKAFVACLLDVSEEYHAGEDVSAFLPHLETLHLEMFPFHDRLKYVYEYRLVDAVAMFLQYRATAGTRIHCLDLDNVDIGNGRLRTWQRWVDEVRGVYLEYDSEPEVLEKTDSDDGEGESCSSSAEEDEEEQVVNSEDG